MEQEDSPFSWGEATMVDLPHQEGSVQESTTSQHEALAPPEEETWPITKRDIPLSNETAIRVMDHAHVVLETRLSETNEGLDVFRFETSLARFLNSEIELGKRIAFGHFADIFLIRSFKELKAAKACTPEQAEAAQHVRDTYGASQLVIKVLRPSLLIYPVQYATGAADILTEGTILATLDHPHIVKIRGRSIPSVEGFASGKRDSFFLVLERLKCNLIDHMAMWQERAQGNRLIRSGLRGARQNHERLMNERLELMAQLADAMCYLHSKNIIHRDLKLANVGIDYRGYVKLIDFGLAKILPPHNIDKDTFKMTGNTGSVRYMAPEIARGDPYNLKADVYSFSILLYEVLNLEKAWVGLAPHEIRRKVIQRKQRPMPSLFWPADIRELLKSTWSDLPSGRLSMTHVHAVLAKQLMLMPSR